MQKEQAEYDKILERYTIKKKESDNSERIYNRELRKLQRFQELLDKCSSLITAYDSDEEEVEIRKLPAEDDQEMYRRYAV